MKGYNALVLMVGGWVIFIGVVLTVLAVSISLGYAPLSWSDNVTPIQLAVFAALLFSIGAVCIMGSQT